jgi:signal peptidase I
MARAVNSGDGFTGESSGEIIDGVVTDHPVASEATEGARGRHAAPVAPRGRRPFRWIIEVAIIAVVAVAVVVAVRAFLVSPVVITTDAMAQTLVPGDRILVSSSSTSARRGEVIAFQVPADWAQPVPDADTGWTRWVRSPLTYVGLVPPERDSVMVLRVIATGGQRIACCSATGQLELDGVPLLEPYLRPGVPTDQVTFDVVVPEGRLFVLGDDRDSARDSRYHLVVDDGTVALADVIGRAFITVWPLDRIGPIDIKTGSAQ